MDKHCEIQHHIVDNRFFEQKRNIDDVILSDYTFLTHVLSTATTAASSSSSSSSSNNNNNNNNSNDVILIDKRLAFDSPTKVANKYTTGQYQRVGVN